MFVALKIAQTKHRLELLAAAMDFPSPTYTTREANISNIFKYQDCQQIKVANGTSHFTKPTRIAMDCWLHRMASVSHVMCLRMASFGVAIPWLTCTVSGCNSMSRGVKSLEKRGWESAEKDGIGRQVKWSTTPKKTIVHPYISTWTLASISSISSILFWEVYDSLCMFMLNLRESHHLVHFPQLHPISITLWLFNIAMENHNF